MPAIDMATPPIARPDYSARALAIWPGLDRQKLRRTQGDPKRIARLVERRTRLSVEAIVGLLTGRAGNDADDATAR